MIVELFSVPKTAFLTIRKQQTLNWLISRKFEVTILLRKSEGIKGHPKQIMYGNDPLGVPEHTWSYFSFSTSFRFQSGENVLIVIGGDDQYSNASEEERSVISRWARRKISSQFQEELMDGRKSFIFSWNKKHRAIHEEALLHYFDPNRKGHKFEYHPKKSSEVSTRDKDSEAENKNIREGDDHHRYQVKRRY